MNTTSLIIALAMLLAAGGGYYYYYSAQHAPETMMEAPQEMQQTESDAMKAAEMGEGPEGGADEAMASDAMSDSGAAMASEADASMEAGAPGTQMMIAAHGSYETYDPSKLALAEDGTVVLFFRADWCPTCRALDADIRAHLEAIPQGLTILDVNYDSYTDMKKKYGVTYQHTLVEVDAAGNMMKKWSGSPTLASLVAEVK
jgi:thiol-disulfide isomerase/thioredoxin